MLNFRCPKCGRKSIYSKKDGRVRCFVCGYEGKREEFFDDENKDKEGV